MKPFAQHQNVYEYNQNAMMFEKQSSEETIHQAINQVTRMKYRNEAATPKPKVDVVRNNFSGSVVAAAEIRRK
jgi:hypothetical protein